MSTKRKQTWPEELHTFFQARKETPFNWGTNDCCLFCADAIEAMTGTDPAPEFRGKYSDQAGAMAAIKSVCNGATVEDAIAYVATVNGLTKLSTVLLAQRGDLVALDSGAGIAAGIVHLNGREALFVSDTGLRRLPLRKCKSAWRVS
jgi:hypothetical protein